MLSRALRTLRHRILGHDNYCVFKKYRIIERGIHGRSRQCSTWRTAAQTSHGRRIPSSASHRILPFFLSNANNHDTHDRSCMMTHLCDAIELDVFSNEIAADIQSKQQQFESNEWYLTCGTEQLNVVRESTIPVLVRKRESYEQHVGQRLSDHARLWAEENNFRR